MAPKHNGNLMKVLKRIPVFDGLSPSQLQKLIGICASRSLATGEALFHRGDASDAMYILVRGAISLLRQDGIEMARFEPVSPLGELGIIADFPRRVSAHSTADSMVLVLPRRSFDMLLSDDLKMSVTVLRNLVLLISVRIDEDNVRAFEHEETCSRLSRLERERELTQQALQARGVDTASIRTGIEAQLREAIPTVLIVDDESEICDFLSRALAEYDVVTAEDGIDALEAAADRPPSIVITDVNMPNMDGLELLQKLKETRPDLPVIGLSGYVNEGAAEKLGFDDFVFKPMRVAQLRNLVKAHLNKSV